MLDDAVVDGFLLSASQTYLPTSYRAAALVNMEVLRKAAGFRNRWFLAPTNALEPVSAYSQVEYQLGVEAGSYIWGLSFTAPFGEVTNAAGYIYLQITDSCTETPFFSDYIKGSQLAAASGAARRNPTLIAPRLISAPGYLDIEIYNSAPVGINCQLAILVAEPHVPPASMMRMLIESGTADAEAFQ